MANAASRIPSSSAIKSSCSLPSSLIFQSSEDIRKQCERNLLQNIRVGESRLAASQCRNAASSKAGSTARNRLSLLCRRLLEYQSDIGMCCSSRSCTKPESGKRPPYELLRCDQQSRQHGLLPAPILEAAQHWTERERTPLSYDQYMVFVHMQGCGCARVVS